MSARSATILAGILIVAAFLRLYRLDQLPVSLAWDEVALLVDAKALAATGRDMHAGSIFQTMFPSWGDFKLPVYVWSATFWTYIFGSHYWVVRLPSAVSGVLTTFIGMALAEQLTQGPHATKNRQTKNTLQVAPWVGLVLATAPWSVVISRGAFEAMVGQFLLSASLLLAVLWRNKPKLLPLSSVVAALAVYSYYSIRFVWSVVFSILIVTQLWQRQSEHRRRGKAAFTPLLTHLVPSLLIFTLLLVPLWKSPYYGPSQQFRLSTPSVLNETTLIHEANDQRALVSAHGVPASIGKLVFSQKTLRLQQFAGNLAHHLSFDFLFFTGDHNLRHGTGEHGLFYWFWIPFLPIGALYLLTRKPAAAVFLLGWWLCALVPASVPFGDPHALRSLNALVPASIYIGVGMWWVATKRRWLGGTIFLGSALAIGGFWFTYTQTYPIYSADAWSDGYEQLVAQVEQVQAANPGVPVLVERVDGRIPLWFLASGRVPAQSIAVQPFREYLFTKVGEISFDNFPSNEALAAQKTPLILVADPYRFAQLPAELAVHILELQSVYSRQGTPRGMIALYQP